MTKLSATQERAMASMKHNIDIARNNDFWNWLTIYNCISIEYAKRWMESNAKEKEFWQKAYNDKRNGIMEKMESTATLKALEKKGLIEILYIGGEWIDHVKVLNY